MILEQDKPPLQVWRAQEMGPPETILPATAAAAIGLGRIYLDMMGQPDRAEPCFRHAIRLAPDDATAHFGLAQALALQGRLPEALRHIEESVRLEPANVEAREGRDSLREALASRRQAMTTETR